MVLPNSAKSMDSEKEKWQKNLSWLAGKQLSFVAIMSIIQVVMLGLMVLTMFMLGVLFN